MTDKRSIIKTLGNYFAFKGKVLTYEEYKEEKDAPIRLILIKRSIGSWARLLKLVGDIKKYDSKLLPEELVLVDDENLEEPAEEEVFEAVEVVVRGKKPTTKG